MSTIGWRLRIRNATDSADMLSVSSVRGDMNPDAVSEPSGDGAEFDPFAGSYRSGSMTFSIGDAITSGTDRLVTAKLEDTAFRQQLSSKPAYIERSINGGSWQVIHAGIVTGLRLSNAAQWDVDVGDTTRSTRNLQAFAPKRNASDATKVEPFTDYLARWPNRGCVAGGPILGGFLGRSDLGGWEVKVVRSTTWNGMTVKALEVSAAYFPTGFGRTTGPTAAQIRPVNEAIGPKGQTPLPSTFPDDFPPSCWPDLVVRVGSNYYAAASFEQGIPTGAGFFASDLAKNVAVFMGGGPFYGQFTFHLFDPDGTLPAVGTGGLRCSIFTALPTEKSPIYYAAHPLDWWTKLADESDLAYDSTSVTAVKGTLGTSIRACLRITAVQPWASFVESTFYGPCGFSVRTAVDGTLVPFTTQITSSTLPSIEVTNADVPQTGTVLFDLSEPDAITKVTFNQTNLVAAQADDTPADGLRAQSVQVIRTWGDGGGPVQREQTYTIPGFLDTGSGAYEPGLVDAIAYQLFDRAGRGRLTGELALLRDGSAGSVVLGDEVLVSLNAMPNRNKRYGDDPSVGGRCVQILRLTPTAWGAMAKFMDSGPNAQPATPLPTLSLADGPPGAGVALTITNAATLNAAGIAVRVRWAPSMGVPASTDYSDVLYYAAGTVPTGPTLLPLVPAGFTVFAKARSEQADKRPSAYSTPVSRATAAMTAPSGISVTPDASDGSRATVAWTVGASTAVTDIYLRLSTLAFADAIRMAAGLLPGTIRYPLAGLIPGDAYIVSAVHRDPVTGSTTKAEYTFTAGSTTRTLSPPTNPVGIVGSTDPSTGVGHLDGTYGLNVDAAELPGFVTFWEAIETGVGTGTYGSFTQVSGMVPSVSGGPTEWRGVSNNALLRKQLKARHEATGANPSTYTSAVTLDAWGTVQSPPEPAATTLPPVAALDIVSFDDTQVTLALSGTLGDGDPGPLEYHWRTDMGAWSAYGTGHANQTITRAPKATKVFQFQTRQSDGQESQIISFPVTGHLPQVDSTTGLVNGLDASGLVTNPVPLPVAAANIPAISTSTGKLKPGVVLDGTPYLPVHTGDAVSALTDGATVTSGAAKANAGLDASGLVTQPVPLPQAVANVPAISSSTGKLKPGITLDGVSYYPVHTGDAVSALTDGPTVTSYANRAGAAIDGGNIVNPASIDFVRSYTNKHLGNIADDATSDRRAATATEKTGGGRAANTHDSASRIWAPAASPIGVGAPGSPGTLTKVIRVPYSMFAPNSSTTAYKGMGSGYVGSTSAGGITSFVAPLYIPIGATITSLRQRSYINSGAAGVTAGLSKYDDAGTFTSIGGATNSTSGGWGDASTSLSETVSGSYIYALTCDLNASLSGTDGAARLMYVEITYTIPDYSKGI